MEEFVSVTAGYLKIVSGLKICVSKFRKQRGVGKEYLAYKRMDLMISESNRNNNKKGYTEFNIKQDDSRDDYTMTHRMTHD